MAQMTGEDVLVAVLLVEVVLLDACSLIAIEPLCREGGMSLQLQPLDYLQGGNMEKSSNCLTIQEHLRQVDKRLKKKTDCQGAPVQQLMFISPDQVHSGGSSR